MKYVLKLSLILKRKQVPKVQEENLKMKGSSERKEMTTLATTQVVGVVATILQVEIREDLMTEEGEWHQLGTLTIMTALIPSKKELPYQSFRTKNLITKLRKKYSHSHGMSSQCQPMKLKSR